MDPNAATELEYHSRARACVARVQAGNAPPVELREAVPGVSTMSMPSCSSAPTKGA